ncbi:MAG: hypothetical protein J7M14_06380 [Planctomycetes bacterium]|nr:hypothetical protein [Planctomycetota bacterium]
MAKTATAKSWETVSQSGNDGVFEEITRLVEAAKAGKLETRADVDQFDGQDRVMLQGVNEMLDAVIAPLNMMAENVDRISKGDIPEEITDEYKGDFNEVKNNLNQLIAVTNGLLAETNNLIQTTLDGKLDTRADADKFAGDWGALIGGINNIVEAFVAPLNMMAENVDRISKGDIPEEITDEYKGDFNEIKNNLNHLIEIMNGLLAETDNLAKAIVDGKLDTRGDADRFAGGWGTLVGGVNNLIEAFAAPFNVTAEYVDRISKGDIPEEITEAYKGDFNEIKNNLNQCIKALRALIVEDGGAALLAAAEKDLTKRVQREYQGAYDQMKNNINQTIDALDNALSQVSGAVAQVAGASGQISAGSQSLAQGTAEQAASLEEVTSSIEEMASMTKQNAANATEAKNLAAGATQNADKGGEAMRRMSAAIDDIKKSSDDTAKIVKTIDEIAFQTNMLALNAAVEAARAGEAGKGFAVVAEEVRNLAQRSAEAARNTAEMIDESVKNSDNGVEIAKEVGGSLEQIADGNRKVNDLIAEIAAASDEQSQGAEQITIAVSQMDQVTQSAAANAEESAAAAEELNAQAGELRNMTDQFKLSNVTAAKSSVAATHATTTAAAGLNFQVDKSAPKTTQAHKAAQPKRPAASNSDRKDADKEALEDAIPMDSEKELAKF